MNEYEKNLNEKINSAKELRNTYREYFEDLVKETNELARAQVGGSGVIWAIKELETTILSKYIHDLNREIDDLEQLLKSLTNVKNLNGPFSGNYCV